MKAQGCHAVSLRLITHRDVAFFHQLFNDTRITQFNDIPAAPTKQQTRALIQDDINLNLSQQGARLVIVLNNSVVGSCGFYDYNANTQSAKLGFELSPSHWGKGVMFHALTLLFSQYKTWLNQPITQVFAHIDSRNIASQRLVKKLGFELLKTAQHNQLQQWRYTF